MDQEHKLNRRRKRRKSDKVRCCCFRFLTLKEVNRLAPLRPALSASMAEAQHFRRSLERDLKQWANISLTEDDLTNTSTDGQNCSCHCGRHNAITTKNVNELYYQGVLILGMYAKDSLYESKFLYVEKLISIRGVFFGATNQLPYQET